MHRRIVAIAMASVLSLSAAGSLHAAPFGVFRHNPSEKQVKAKMISFNVRNDCKETLVLQAGEEKYSIEPGKSAALRLEEGAQVIAVNGTNHVAAGAVLTKVSKELSGNTLAVS
jgi:hypothetical protein